MNELKIYTCYECGGDGTYEEDIYEGDPRDPETDYHTEKVECEICNGTGEIDVEKQFEYLDDKLSKAIKERNVNEQFLARDNEEISKWQYQKNIMEERILLNYSEIAKIKREIDQLEIG